MNTRPPLTLPTLLARSLAVLFLAGAALSSPAALAQSRVMRIIVPYEIGRAHV